ncbi:hypothetical protein BD410DRAFT_582248 [Rickenella mellea]|uniref:Uncharacterized protein n=1 Tax=Rickenella mellea TaxID=50990 RepID=A0A4Y7PQ21_9AGAM|nr:hypothetical protein BD410DRAFT_582248 [Rickenella mellea]
MGTRACCTVMAHLSAVVARKAPCNPEKDLAIIKNAVHNEAAILHRRCCCCRPRTRPMHHLMPRGRCCCCWLRLHLFPNSSDFQWISTSSFFQSVCSSCVESSCPAGEISATEQLLLAECDSSTPLSPSFHTPSITKRVRAE